MKKSVLLVISVLMLTSVACASWKTKSTSEKYQAAVVYYQTFSSGLHAAAAMLPTSYAQTAGAALSVVDSTVAMLASLVETKASSMELEQASTRAAAAVATANAVVAAGV